MAKPLQQSANKSPLSRLLDPAAARGARTDVPSLPSSSPTEAFHTSSASPGAGTKREHSLIKRECVLTGSTDEALSRLTEMVRRSTGARINTSCAVRSLLLTLSGAWPRLEDELRSLGVIKLPGNARGREHEREAMERLLAQAIHRALRSSTGPG
jgi:hypothetical protein